MHYQMRLRYKKTSTFILKYVELPFTQIQDSLARSQNCKKRLLASSCLSVRSSVRLQRPSRLPLYGL